MLVLFSITTILHTGQAIYFRLWWLLPTVILCGIAEIVGWAVRVWSSISPELLMPYKIQISTTIIAPTPLVAANFIMLGILISRLGPQYSRLSPKWYTIIFCTCDVISLIIQGIGGGLITGATTVEAASKRSHVTLAGTAFQLGAIVIYALFAVEFFLRCTHNRPVRVVTQHTEKPIEAQRKMPRKLKLMSIALCFNTLFLFIRALYRVIELNDGWNGRIIHTEVYFNVCDGAMVILSMYTVNILHPGYLLSKKPASDSDVSSVSTSPGQMSSL